LKNIAPIATQQFLEKADHFLQGMNLLSDGMSTYRSGISLLAIHSAISLTDAIRIGLTGTRGKYQDHMQAATELSTLCASHRVSDRRGIGHLKWLLGQKSIVAYERNRLDDKTVLLAVDKAQKFSAWAYNCFEEILRAQGSA
jgi:hypothetical protein